MDAANFQQQLATQLPKPQQKSHYRSRAPRRPQEPAMALNCIVDDSALLAGIRDNAKESLKRWVADGAVNLFVPLYTLEKLNQLRSSPPPTNLDARKTLEWLDNVTSATEGNTVGRVQLQGPDDQYQTWEEVERYLLPDTPLSTPAGHELSDLSTALDQRLSLGSESQTGDQLEDVSVEEDTHLAKSFNGNDKRLSRGPSGAQDGQSNVIPGSVRPLLNFVVWRSHHEDSTLSGNGKYLLLTDDTTTLKQAQKFGVRAKMLSQVRTIVSREGKRASRGSTTSSPRAGRASMRRAGSNAPSREVGDDEEEVLFNPSKRPGSSRGAKSSPDVWDPDHFGRTPTANSPDAANASASPNAPRGGRGAARGGRGSMRGRAGVSAGRQPPQQLAKPIDPDSYDRPPPSRGRGRGGFAGRLWNPNT